MPAIRASIRTLGQNRSIEIRKGLLDSLVSVAGLVGRPVDGSDGARVGRLLDVVVHAGSPHPLVSGFVVKIGPRRVWLSTADVGGLAQGELRLQRARFDMKDVVRRPGEIQLVADVIDHQLVDLHGVRVVRASDLYLGLIDGSWCLMAVDVSWTSFLRRALPGRTGRRASPRHVLDWAGIHSLGVADDGQVQTDASKGALKLLSAADLADLLEDLGRSERHELLDDLTVEDAADALELMAPADLASLLRHETPERAAELLAVMERDEAVDALRDLTEDDRDGLLAAMPPEAQGSLRHLLGFEERTAGGMMTNDVVIVAAASSVGDAVAALRAAMGRRDQANYVVLVDEAGRLVDDVTALELLAVDADTPVSDLIGEPWPVAVAADASLDDVVEAIRANRSSSVLVVDEHQQPLGRIVADDVIDALSEDAGRRWPWQREVGVS